MDLALICIPLYNETLRGCLQWGKEKISKKKFTERNQNIYEGIEAKDIKISIPEKEKLKGNPVTVKYSETMETSADEISFDNAVTLQKEDGRV